MRVHNKHIRAHRFSFELHYGSFDTSLHVLHKCDNPRCVNPKHLFLGTHAQNMKDRNQKGRAAANKGIFNGQHFLNEKEVIEIRKLRPKMSFKAIALLYKVSPFCIEDIIYRRSWRHI